MTLKDYLHITDDSFVLEFEDYWYYHNGDTNFLLNLQTKEKRYYLNDFDHEIPLSEYFGIANHEACLQLNLYHMNIIYKQLPIYTETVADVKLENGEWGFIVTWGYKPQYHKNNKSDHCITSYDCLKNKIYDPTNNESYNVVGGVQGINYN